MINEAARWTPVRWSSCLEATRHRGARSRLMNAATPLSYNQAFIPNGAWLTPNSVLSARFAKLSAQFDF